ncbi:hypothetical protein PSACC_00939 [Paramicrosporidium saccamoebae]|uniref:K Homology domain-containing protein n=1 Tax=Paramicrosporidium saccamoebae TaxID=1246581 RepID=A0A2H9TNA1_9FUNG|nr:hypothetical protein PSACC_00939 [Paramicrosporidium saccamoebae]
MAGLKPEEAASQPEPSTVSTKKPTLDLASHEMFPTLGAAHGTATLSILMQALVRPSGITQVFQMPYEHQRRREGPNLAELCQQIGRETDTVIDASRSGQTQVCTFVIKGTTEGEIMAARRKIWSRLAETATIALDVPEECLGLVIGPQGRKIAALMSDTSTRITVHRPYSGQVSIAGDFEGISLAKQYIEALIHDKLNKMSSSFKLERHLIPFVFECSTSGRITPTIRDFAAKHTVKILTDLKDPELATLAFSGNRANVVAAMRELEERTEKVRKTIKTVSTQVPKPLHRFLVGPKAETLYALEEETGCYISVPPPDNPSDSITVYGKDDALLKGVRGILDKTSAVDSQVVHANEQIKSLLIHQSRSLIRDLEKKYSVHIHQSDAGFVLDGKKAEVMVSVMELKGAIEALSAYQFERISVDAEYIKHVIGKQGHNLQQIEAEFGVEIIITERESENVVIAGTSPQVISAAKEHITKKIANLADLRVAEVHVDSKFHGALIGAKGTNIKKTRERYPSILITFEKDSVRLQGPSKEVAEAQCEILKEAETIRHDAIMHSYSGNIALTPETFSAATNSDGKIVRSLSNFARDHGIRNLEVDSRTLTFQGLKKDVESFKVSVVQFLQKIADRGSEIIQVEPEFHGALIGKNGKNAKHFAQKYDITLVLPTSTEEVKSDIKIVGPRSNFQEAIAEIHEFIAYEKSHRHRETITVPNYAVPAILGRKGAVISSLRFDTDTNIDLNKDHDREENYTMTFEGTLEGIETAKKLVAELVDNCKVSETISPGTEKFKLLTGIGNAAFRALITKYEALEIGISTVPSKEEFVIRGKRKVLPSAIKELSELFSTEFMTETVDIPTRFHGEIMGRGGANVQRIRTTFSVSIHFPKKENPADTLVTVEGAIENVKLAKAELLHYVREPQVVPVSLEDRQEIVAAVTKKFPNLKVQGKPNGIQILGDAGELEKALAFVKDMEATLKASTQIMTVPLQYHGAIIGRSGMNLEKVKGETGCSIFVPKRDENSDQVKLRGTPKAIEDARQVIAQMVSRLSSADA